MNSNALITKRDVRLADVAASIESKDAIRVGAQVILHQEHGTLVRGTNKQFKTLEKEGYRVIVYENTNILKVGSWSIDTEVGEPKLRWSLKVPSELRSKWTHHLVQLVGPPTTEWIQSIESKGLEVGGRVSQYGLFVYGEPEKIKSLNDLSFVNWTGFFQPAYRIDSKLDKQSGTIKNVRIGIYPHDKIDEVLEAL
jgi:hypothetical protein